MLLSLLLSQQMQEQLKNTEEEYYKRVAERICSLRSDATYYDGCRYQHLLNKQGKLPQVAVARYLIGKTDSADDAKGQEGQAMYYKIEKGLTRLSMFDAIKLAYLYDVDVAYVMCLSDEKHQNVKSIQDASIDQLLQELFIRNRVRPETATYIKDILEHEQQL